MKLRTPVIMTLIFLCACKGKKEPNTSVEHPRGYMKPADDNTLLSEVLELELHYITWACDCANWATAEDEEKYANNENDSLAARSIFVEPSDSSLILPDTLGYNSDVIKFTGRFYAKRSYPQGYRSFENPDKARVFRYTKYVVVKSNYREATKID